VSSFSVKWIYRLELDQTIELGKYYRRSFEYPLSFRDRSGAERLVLFPSGRAVVTAGYAWDGCTPKYALFDVVLGVPDGVPNSRTRKPKTYHASLVHDVLYQFLDVHQLPIDRSGADSAFFDLLKRDAFAPRAIYWLAVRLLGGIYRRGTRIKRRYRGHCVEVRPATRESELPFAA
jgi:hypothetical protein